MVAPHLRISIPALAKAPAKAQGVVLEDRVAAMMTVAMTMTAMMTMAMTMVAMMTMAMTMVATKADKAVTTMAATIPAITGEKAKARVAPLKGALVKAAWTPARPGPEREFPRWSLVD